jgi:hypothetical protein
LIASGVSSLHEAMARGENPTFGDFLWSRLKAGLPVRVRINDAAQDESDKSGKTYAFYPDRSLLEAEFEAIWSAQEPYHPAIRYFKTSPEIIQLAVMMYVRFRYLCAMSKTYFTSAGSIFAMKRSATGSIGSALTSRTRFASIDLKA